MRYRILLVGLVGLIATGCVGLSPMMSVQSCLKPGTDVPQTVVTTLHVGSEKYMYEAVAPSCQQGTATMKQVP